MGVGLRLAAVLGVTLGVCACAATGGGAGSAPGTAGTPAAGPSPAAGAAPVGRVLVFSRTAGYRHASIPDARAVFEALGKEHGFGVDLTEDPAVFTDDGLGRYAVVVFLHTTGKVLDRPAQAALERWLAGGRGWVGVHAAADADPDWAWYAGLLGTRFVGHPAIQPATIRVEDRAHPATVSLPAVWERTDEWYNFDASPRGRVHVLATLDERTFDGGLMGEDHPIAWCHEYGGGRVFYTALGHTVESWAEPLVVAHVLGGVRWASGAAAAGCPPG